MYSVPLWVKAVWVPPVLGIPMQDVDGHCHSDPLGNGDSIDHHSFLTVAKEAMEGTEQCSIDAYRVTWECGGGRGVGAWKIRG